jgi:hypothetical protein
MQRIKDTPLNNQSKSVFFLERRRGKSCFPQRTCSGKFNFFPKQPGLFMKKIFTAAKNIYTSSGNSKQSPDRETQLLGITLARFLHKERREKNNAIRSRH